MILRPRVVASDAVPPRNDTSAASTAVVNKQPKLCGDCKHCSSNHGWRTRFKFWREDFGAPWDFATGARCLKLERDVFFNYTTGKRTSRPQYTCFARLDLPDHCGPDGKLFEAV